MKKHPVSKQQLSKWTAVSAFVFTGRIIALGTSNLDGVEPEKRMATVQVKHVALAPSELGDLRDRVITVYLKTTRDLSEGDEATFFARSWHYGRNIGVVEIGRTSSSTMSIGKDVVEARLQQLDQHLVDRIQGARVIISGRVTGTSRVEQRDNLPGTEEGVEWWVADMWIGSVEKGRMPDDNRIWFPEGGDSRWGAIPNVHVRQEGVWLLRPITAMDQDENEPDEGLHRERFRDDIDSESRLMAIDTLDYHGLSNLPRIRTLLRWSAQL